MPYITTERVAEIRAQIKKAFPDFNFSITNENKSTVKIVILSGSIVFKENQLGFVNVYGIQKQFKGAAANFLSKIYKIANKGNKQSHAKGYFSTVPKFYVDILIGDDDRPYQFIKHRNYRLNG